MKITCLIENTTNDPTLTAEHGLSLYIEAADRKILFDMGQSRAFADNANKLGIDLSKVTTAILSHGHYDHGGGLKHFLEINKNAKVYVSRYAFEPHYNSDGKYIGLDTELAQDDRLIFTEDHFAVGNNLSLHSCNEKQAFFNMMTHGMTVERNGQNFPDTFLHEQYLLIEENGKRILISGCSHKGILDITQWFTPDVLVGGFHFSKLPIDDKLTEYAKKLDSFGTEFYTCHCTGTDQYSFMKKHMQKLNYLSTGNQIII